MTTYSAHVEIITERPVTEEALDAIFDALHHTHSGAVAGGDHRLSATISIDALDIGQAALLAEIAVRTAALPTRTRIKEVVRLEVMTDEEFDAYLNRPTLPDLVSGAESGEILGVSRQRLHQLHLQHPDFPKPLYQLRVGPLWDRAAIEAFDSTWTRKSGRPVLAVLVDDVAPAKKSRKAVRIPAELLDKSTGATFVRVSRGDKTSVRRSGTAAVARAKKS